MRRLFTALLCVIALFIPTVTAGAASMSGPFIDDDGVPGELDIEHLADIGAIQGCNPPANNRSCPQRVLTRVEAFKILVVAGQAHGVLAGFPSSLPERFVDDNDVWNGAASRLSNFLAGQGIVHGCNPPRNNLICPNEKLTRAQVAKLVVNTFRLTAPSGFRTPWTDTSGRWFDQSARIAAHHRLWDSSAGVFDGGAQVTRAEFAQVVVRAMGTVLCADNPFTAGRVAALQARYPSQSFTAYAYDTHSRCAYWMNPDERLRTASVFKVLVMAGTLLEAQNDGRSLTSWERSQLVPMITESANSPVRALWRSFGGSPWFNRQADLFGLDETDPVGDTQSVWGRTTTSAKDQGDLIRQVLLGDWGPLTTPYRQEARNLMTSVVPSQTWGVTAGVPSGWTVAQKNGFAGHIANSVGFVTRPSSNDGYVVVVLSNGWPNWERGVAAVEQIAGWVSGSLAR